MIGDCRLPNRFHPLPPPPGAPTAGLLEALQSESPRSEGGSTPSPTSKAEDEYLAPAEATLLADGALPGCTGPGACACTWLRGWRHRLRLPRRHRSRMRAHAPLQHTRHASASALLQA